MATYFWNPESVDGNMANPLNWYPEPPSSGGVATFSNGDNLSFGALGIDTSSIYTGLFVAKGVTLGTVSWYATYQGSYGLAPQFSQDITGITYSGTTATATTELSHGYAVNDTVTVSGASDSNFNGTFAIVSVPSATTFTYTMGGTPAANSSACDVIRNAAPITPCSIARVGDSLLPGTTNSSGAQRLVADFGSSAATVTVTSALTTPGTDANADAVRFLFNNSAASLAVASGRVAVALSTPADVSVIGSLSLSGNNATLDLGAGLTYTTLNNSGGTVNDFGGGSGRTINTYGGKTSLSNQSAIGSVYAYGGTVYPNGRPSGGGNTVTNLFMYGGNCDFSQNPAAAEVGSITHRDGTLITAFPGQLTAGSWSIDLTGKKQVLVTRS